jgi:hypothetical protein
VMTIAMMPAAAPPSGAAVSWRALDDGLWVARRDGRHLGSVQPGRRWLAADADGEPIGTFRAFREAQLAVADPAHRCAAVSGSAGLGPLFAVALLGCAALASAAGWVSTAFVL